MSSVYSLKLICDLSFYLSFAGFICSMATGNSLMGTLPYLFSCAFVSSLLAEKKNIRFIPLVLLLPALFILRENIFNYLFFIPACAYTVYYINSMPYDIATTEYSATYSLFFNIAIPASLIFFIVSRENYESICIPYGLLFTICAIVLMRMLRHDREVLNQTRFKILNSLSVIGVMIAGALAGSAQFLGFVSGLIKSIYFSFIVPVLTFLMMIILYILTPIFNFIGRHNEVYSDFNYQDIIIESGFDLFKEEEISEAGISLTIFKIVFFGILFLAAVYLVYRLYKFFTKKYDPRPSTTKVERTFLDQGRQKKKEPRINHQIRQIYRKFMKLCEDNGVVIYPYTTTEDIARQAANVLGEKEASAQLRSIYIESRYGEVAPTKEKIKQCRDIYNKLKKLEK